MSVPQTIKTEAPTSIITVMIVMNRRLATAILTFTLLSPLLYFVTCSVGANAAGSVHNLNTGLSYTSIQNAIGAGETLGGHTIFVDAGTYNENIVVNKQIRLIGEHPDSTVIKAADRTKNALNITSDNVEISGFNITGATQWYPAACGLYLDSVSNVSISGNYVANNTYGIRMDYSSNNTLANNKIWLNHFGINMYSDDDNNRIIKNSFSSHTGVSLSLWAGSDGNLVTQNAFFDNSDGVDIGYSNFNVISYNNFSYNGLGIDIEQIGNNNTICHNNLIDNTGQAHSILGAANFWDDGYPSGGNYWSNYAGVDAGNDGIGDAPYTIDANNTDRYPLMGMFSDFNATSEYCVQTICNSSISGFQSNATSISFNVTGEDGTAGFCRVCTPSALMNATYRVFVNGTEVQCNLLPCSNTTHSYLYFTYSHSTKEIVIIPELASLIISPLLTIATLLATNVSRRKPFKR
ncbi:right-handed parallel beta-helix repeat-containing protein [Candidatus Bathyarchaeota archaeon]|nr:right-handed parallel beta-helix repeat-containing protein [Candidatus Bathyarchaeota archaeon]